MKPPESVDGITETGRWYIRQMWRDLLSVYYANTPVWRWLKSGALVFLGFFCWTGGSVLLSVRPDWGVLTYVMAYGFVLIGWGPFTHFLVVPLILRLRRSGKRPITRTVARHGGKINLTIFFTIVLLLGTFTPGVMVLDFAPIVPDSGNEVRGDLVCDVAADIVTCTVENAQGIDHIVVTSGEETITTVHDPPYAFEIHVAELTEVRTGYEYVVEAKNEDGETVRRWIRTVPR